MLNLIKSLIVVLSFSALVFRFARPIADIFGSQTNLRRDQAIWIFITVFAFLVPNYYLVLLACVITCVRQSSRHDNATALYFILLLVLPSLDHYLPEGNPKIFINQGRIYGAALLFPAALQLRRRSESSSGLSGIDWLVIIYILWISLISAINVPFTQACKDTVYLLIDTWLPYFVASRSLRGLEQFHRFGASVVVFAAIIGLIGLFESVWHWILYSQLSATLGATLLPYNARGSSDLLRGVATMGSIPLGYTMMIAIGFIFLLWPRISSNQSRFALLFAILGGLLGSLSRGPWVGVAAVLILVVVLGPGASKRIFYGLFGVGAAFLVLLLSPYGRDILDLLPFVGTAETGNVDYRSRLLTVSIEVFKETPIVGNYQYLKHPLMKQMIQGEGIVDVVNTYLQLALPFGGIGLAIFVFIFLTGLRRVWRSRQLNIKNPDIERLGRTIIATVTGVLVVISTVSSGSVIAALYWVLAGACDAFARTFGSNESFVTPSARPVLTQNHHHKRQAPPLRRVQKLYALPRCRSE